MSFDAPVLAVLDGGEASPVKELQDRGAQPAPGDLRHGLPRRDQVGERADDGPRRAGQRGPQPQGHLGEHAERALGPDEQPDHVEACHALGGAAAEPHRIAVGDRTFNHGPADHRAQAQHIVAGHAVLQAAQAARVGGHVAADRRPGRAGRVGRVPQAVLGHGRLHVVVDHTWLDHAEQVVPVDLDDPVHPGQVEDHAAVDRVGPAGQAGAGAARHDRRAQLGADPHDLLNLGLRAGPHARGRPPGERPIRPRHGTWSRDVGIGDDPVAGQGPAQRLDQPSRVSRPLRSSAALTHGTTLAPGRGPPGVQVASRPATFGVVRT